MFQIEFLINDSPNKTNEKITNLIIMNTWKDHFYSIENSCEYFSIYL
jgi:hypothetical protein